MGRPLKIKKSTTKDIGFNPFSALTSPVVPAGFTPGSATEYQGVVGGSNSVDTATYPTVKCRVKIGANAEADGFIIRQKGNTKYLVSDGTNTGVCVLADLTDGNLTNGTMNITMTTGDSTAITIAKLTNKFAIDYNDNVYAVNFFTDEGTPAKSGSELNATLPLAIVENYNS